MAHAFSVPIQLIQETCCSCGTVFAMDADLRQRLLDKPSTSFYCPRGHSQHYTATSEAQRLKDENERLKQRLDLERRTHEAAMHGEQIRRGKAEAALRRTTERVNAGVCPYCNRTVAQLARHVHTKHPDQAPHPSGKVPA